MHRFRKIVWKYTFWKQFWKLINHYKRIGYSLDIMRQTACLVLFCSCFSVLLALRLPRLGKRELILVLFVRLLDFEHVGLVYFLSLLVSGKCCSLWLWHSLDFSLTCLPYMDMVIILFNRADTFDRIFNSHSKWNLVKIGQSKLIQAVLVEKSFKDYKILFNANRICMYFCLKSSIGTQGEVC